MIAQLFVALFVMNEAGIAHWNVNERNLFIDSEFNVKLGLNLMSSPFFFLT
jgi:hypothetical protein